MGNVFTILCLGDHYSLFLYVIVPAIVKSRQSKWTQLRQSYPYSIWLLCTCSSIKLKFNIILSICKHFANNLGLHILNCRLSEGPVQGSPFITHLGDGDPNLQPNPQYLYRSSTPEEEQTLQLVIPGLDQSGSGENLLNNSGGNKEENTSGTVHA